jgi:hypothetical protein
MTAPQGPFLYDDGPAPLHTGTPRRRHGLLLALFGGTLLVAVLMVATLPLIKGTPEEQARDTVGVFLKAMAAGDTATTHQMLCAAEQSRLAPPAVADAYGGGGEGTVTGAVRATVGGNTVERVTVAWADGGSSRLTVVGENGPHVCGVTPGK